MIGVLVVCGPSGSGKTTIGRAVAKRLSYVHWEMSDFVQHKIAAYELENGSSIAAADYVEQVLWPSSGFSAVASPVVELIARATVSGEPIRGLVISGPRRREELEAIVSMNQPTLLIYLVVPFITRLERTGGKSEGLLPHGRQTLFAARTEREQEWGLLREPVDESFALVRNDGPLSRALAQIETLARGQLPVRG